MRISTVFIPIFLLVAVTAQSQSLKPLDQQKVMRSNGITMERIEVVSFDEGNPADTCLLAEVIYDPQGRMISRTDYFACGMTLSKEEFYYDESGRLDSNVISHAFDQFTPRLFHLKFSSDGQIVQRELDVEIRNFWKRERYTWNSRNEIEEVSQYRMHNEQLIPTRTIDYRSQNREMHKESSVMFLKAETGLLLVENVYSPAGLTRMVLHTYENQNTAEK